MPDPNQPVPTRERRARRRGLHPAARPIGGGLMILLACVLVAPGALRAQSIGDSTHLEFDLTHDENVGGAPVTFTDIQPGLDGGASLLTTGAVMGTHGTESVTVEAGVVSTTAGTVRLGAAGDHVFDLSGTALFSDVWTRANSNLLARASVVDELTLSGFVGTSATVELYFQIRGQADAMITVDAPPADARYSLATQIRLEATTSPPHTGSGPHLSSVVFPGAFLIGSYDETLVVDEYVMLSLVVDPSQPIPLTLEFEITPTTDLQNGVELGTLTALGMHSSSFSDPGAELLGVVVRDGLGAPVGSASITALSGFDYPVVPDPPAPFPPTTVILSPVAVVDSDLGEAGSSTPFEQMIDQSGLTVPFTSGQTGFDVQLSLPNGRQSSNSFTANWQSATVFTLPLQGYVDFDLGAPQAIDRLAIWNVTLEDVRVMIADDPLGPWTEVGQYTLLSHVFYGTYDAEVLDLNGTYAARYVRLQIDSAYLIDPSFTWASVSEVAVSAAPAPEPGFGIGLALGLGPLAAIGRRRRLAGPLDPR